MYLLVIIFIFSLLIFLPLKRNISPNKKRKHYFTQKKNYPLYLYMNLVYINFHTNSSLCNKCFLLCDLHLHNDLLL